MNSMVDRVKPTMQPIIRMYVHIYTCTYVIIIYIPCIISMYIVHRKCRGTSMHTSREVLEKDWNHCHPTSPTARSLFACRKRLKKTERL